MKKTILLVLVKLAFLVKYELPPVFFISLFFYCRKKKLATFFNTTNSERNKTEKISRGIGWVCLTIL